VHRPFVEPGREVAEQLKVAACFRLEVQREAIEEVMIDCWEALLPR
jgi:hypothetical protein